MKSKTAMVVGCALAVSLGGCATYQTTKAKIDPADLGEANRLTYAAMIVDPEPVYDTEMPTSAEHAAQAEERYRKDKVKKPATIRSTSGTGGGGGGSGPQ